MNTLCPPRALLGQESREQLELVNGEPPVQVSLPVVRPRVGRAGVVAPVERRRDGCGAEEAGERADGHAGEPVGARVPLLPQELAREGPRRSHWRRCSVATRAELHLQWLVVTDACGWSVEGLQLQIRGRWHVGCIGSGSGSGDVDMVPAGDDPRQSYTTSEERTMEGGDLSHSQLAGLPGLKRM